MINTKNYIEFLYTHKITPNQYLLLHLIYKRRIDLIANYESIFEKRLASYEDIKNLVKRGFLRQTEEEFTLTDKLLDLYITADQATDEIYDIYPTFVVNSNGNKLPLTAMDRREFANLYIGKINADRKEHKEVLKDIRYGIDNNLINYGIAKFVGAEMWKPLRKLRQPLPNQKPAEDMINEEDF